MNIYPKKNIVSIMKFEGWQVSIFRSRECTNEGMLIIEISDDFFSYFHGKIFTLHLFGRKLSSGKVINKKSIFNIIYPDTDPFNDFEISILWE